MQKCICKNIISKHEFPRSSYLKTKLRRMWDNIQPSKMKKVTVRSKWKGIYPGEEMKKLIKDGDETPDRHSNIPFIKEYTKQPQQQISGCKRKNVVNNELYVPPAKKHKNNPQKMLQNISLKSRIHASICQYFQHNGFPLTEADVVERFIEFGENVFKCIEQLHFDRHIWLEQRVLWCIFQPPCAFLQHDLMNEIILFKQQKKTKTLRDVIYMFDEVTEPQKIHQALKELVKKKLIDGTDCYDVRKNEEIHVDGIITTTNYFDKLLQQTNFYHVNERITCSKECKHSKMAQMSLQKKSLEMFTGEQVELIHWYEKILKEAKKRNVRITEKELNNETTSCFSGKTRKEIETMMDSLMKTKLIIRKPQHILNTFRVMLYCSIIKMCSTKQAMTERDVAHYCVKQGFTTTRLEIIRTELARMCMHGIIKNHN